MIGEDYKEQIARLLYSRSNEKVLLKQALNCIWGDVIFEDALDIGPGPGEVTECLASRARRLTLVESNSSYEMQLRRQFPAARIHMQSVQAFDLVPNSWDQILLSHVLYYLRRAEWLPLCTRIRQSLRPRGSLIVVINGARGDCWHLVNHFRDLAESNKGFALVATPEFSDSLRTLGSVHCQSYSYQIAYDCVKDAADFIGRQFLEIHDSNVLQSHYAEFEDVARQHCRGDRVIFTFEADIICVRA